MPTISHVIWKQLLMRQRLRNIMHTDRLSPSISCLNSLHMPGNSDAQRQSFPPINMPQEEGGSPAHNGVPSYLRKYKRCPSHQPIAKRTSTVLAAFNILAASINIILRGNTICPSVRFLLTKQKLPYEVRYE